MVAIVVKAMRNFFGLLPEIKRHVSLVASNITRKKEVIMLIQLIMLKFEKNRDFSFFIIIDTITPNLLPSTNIKNLFIISTNLYIIF